MAKYGSASVTVTLDDSAGTPRIVTGFVLTMGALKITNKTQPSTPFGVGWEEALATGMRKGEKVSLGGLLDDTALTGTFATMIPTAADAVPGFTRTLVVVIGGAKTFTAECILESGSAIPKVGALTEYAAELTPTGACAWT